MSRSRWTPRHETPEPLEGDDVAVISVGTVVWLVLFLVQLPFYDWYARHGHAWWIWCCAAGTGGGLVGLAYVRRRREAIRRRTGEAGGPAGPGPDGG